MSALGETLDHASLAAAQKVFRDGFFASCRASELVLPRRPLGEIFDDRVGKWLADRNVAVHLGSRVRYVERDARFVVRTDRERCEFDAVVVAVPWHKVSSLLCPELLAAMPALEHLERIERAGITSVHLWFDRPVVPVAHAAFVGRLSQWVFAEHCDADGACASRQHCQVLLSATHRIAKRRHDELLAEVFGELESIWPAVGQAKLLNCRVVAQPAAVFSMTPEVDRMRPSQQTPIANLALAGDWTSTGWPATMEGAVRSGFAAVERIAESGEGGGDRTEIAGS